MLSRIHLVAPLLITVALGELSAQEAARTPFPRAEPESVGCSTAKLTAAVQQIRDWVDSGDAVGAEILVVKDRKTILHEAIGWKNREDKVPMERNTICRIRSMTKPFVGTAILMLADAGTIDLDDPVREYIPAYDNERSKDITIAHLLRHEGGFDQPGYPVTDIGTYDNLREAVDAVGHQGPKTPPGIRYSYSDAGSATLGAIVAEVSQMPAEDFIAQRIIAPLGLPDTFCNLTADDSRRPRVSCTYVLEDGEFRKYWDNSAPQSMKYFRASGGMYSTTTDYARFLAAWMDGGVAGDTRLLSKETVARALTPSEHTRERISGYGLHWMVFKDLDDKFEEEQLPRFGHAGSDGTIAIAIPAEDLIVCYFTQSRGGRTVGRMAKIIADGFDE